MALRGGASRRAAASTIFSSQEPRIERHAVDFDLNWYNGGRSGNFPGLKTISVKPQNRSWPCVDAEYEWVVTLPAQALIANILISRPANAGPAGPYALYVGNGDRSVVYGSDGGGIDAARERSITVQRAIDKLISAGTSSPHNQVRVWASPTTPYRGVTGGYFIVQYY